MASDSDGGSQSGTFKAVGGGCSACGCLLLLTAVVLGVMVAAGAFNYSVEGQATGAAGTSACCGSLALVLGIVLLVIGMRGAGKASGSADG